MKGKKSRVLRGIANFRMCYFLKKINFRVYNKASGIESKWPHSLTRLQISCSQ